MSVLHAGASVLRSSSRAVTVSELPQLGGLIGTMGRVLAETKGQGLSAPQLGEPLRLFMLAPSKGGGEPLVVINPRIVRRSREQSRGWEACLSIPDYAAVVPRAHTVEVDYKTRSWKRVSRVLKGDHARVFQHELDHLDGVLFTERAEMKTFTHVDHVAECAEALDLRCDPG